MRARSDGNGGWDVEGNIQRSLIKKYGLIAGFILATLLGLTSQVFDRVFDLIWEAPANKVRFDNVVKQLEENSANIQKWRDDTNDGFERIERKIDELHPHQKGNKP